VDLYYVMTTLTCIVCIPPFPVMQGPLLHCALSAAQCLVIGPVCLFMGVWLARNCVYRSSPNWVCR